MNGRVQASVGMHRVEISMPGFTTYATTVDVKAGAVSQVLIDLSPSSSNTADYWLSHPADEAVREYLGDLQASVRDERMYKYFPIYKLLPYDGAGYRINFGEMANAKGGSGFAVMVTCDPSLISMSQCRMVTESVIRDGGYNPADYTIEYQSGSVPEPR